MWKECVIDATMGCRDGMFCFCPIEGDISGDFSLVTGMTVLSESPPDSMKLVGIVHEGGQAAVDEFCEQHRAELKQVFTHIPPKK